MGKIAETLPPLPSGLKAVSPYIQRADELRVKDPVMAYWCTYYAAQVGLDMKTHEPGARDYLLALIVLLENMKKDIASNDAVDNEAAGAAYVENFALKVFALADSEDRKGEATRSTAKKFLAAANFLELLKVFEKSNNAKVNEEKVRYAKWKASEIAKAFREGRKPKPGPADEEEAPELTSQSATSATDSPPVRTPSDGLPLPPPPIIHVEAALPGTGPSIHTPPHTPPRKLKSIPHELHVPPPELMSPGNWSNVATPGSVAYDNTDLSSADRWSDFDSPLKNKVPLSGPASRESSSGSGSTLNDQAASNLTLSTSAKKVHFTPSVTGGLSSAGNSPVVSPEPSSRTFVIPPASPPKTAPQDIPPRTKPRVDPAFQPLPDSSPSASSRTSQETSPRMGGAGHLGASPPKISGRVHGSPPRASPPSSSHRSRPNKPSPPQGGTSRSPSAIPPPPPPHISSSPPNPSSVTPTTQYSTVPNNFKPSSPPDRTGFPPSSSSSTFNYVQQPSYSAHSGSVSSFGSQPTRSGPASPPAPAPVPVELNIQQIAKAQKHCRFAISALEYEDAEQARKELRAALAVLGDR